MRVLRVYLGAQVLAASLFVVLVLVGIVSLIQLVSELSLVGVRDYGLLQAFLFVLLSAPRRAVELLPMGVLIGSLIALGALANHGELTAMRACGAPRTRIVTAVGLAGVLLMLLSASVNELVLPEAQRQAVQLRSQALGKGLTTGTRYGLWGRSGDIFFNVRYVLSEGRMREIYLYRFDGQHRLVMAAQARAASYAGGRWTLEDVRLSQLGEDRIEVERHEHWDWQTDLDPDVLKVAEVRPHTLPLWTLRAHIEYLRANGQETGGYETAFWSKVASPFNTLAMLVLALPFVFGSVRHLSAGRRIVTGVGVGIAFHLLTQGSLYAGQAYGLNVVVSALLPTVVAFMGGGYWLKRIR